MNDPRRRADHRRRRVRPGTKQNFGRELRAALPGLNRGASKYEGKEKNRENLKRTKARERRGATGKGRSERQDGPKRTRSELYAEGKHRNISGRSKMSKEELERALH